MYSLNRFQNSTYSLLVYQNNKRIFSSQASALKPLLFFLKKKLSNNNLIIYDKIIGRAAALLLVLVKPQKIYTPILSYSAEKVLQQHKIAVEFKKQVQFISDYSKEKMCSWEKLAKDKTPQQFYKILNNK